MKRAAITSLVAVAAALTAVGCGGRTSTGAHTTTGTKARTSKHTTPSKSPSHKKTATNGRRLPALIAGTFTGTKPSEIDFSADASNIVTGLRWSVWTPTIAVGQGTSGIQSCVPDCASGKVKYVPTTVTLSAPRDGHFTHCTETRNGRTLRAYYRSPPWPLGASARTPRRGGSSPANAI